MEQQTGANILPQGGTSCSAVGESTTLPLEASSPSYSGGGNDCLPLADGNKSRGGSQSQSFEDITDFTFKTPDIGSGGRGVNATATPKFWRKCSRTEKSDLTLSVSLSSSEENLRAAKVPTGRRGRGRATLSGSPIPARVTRGCFLKRLDASAAIDVSDSDRSVQVTRSDTEYHSSLISTKAELNAAKREGRKAIANEEVEEMSRLARVRRSEAAATTGGLTAAALNRQIMDGVDVVMKVATKSGNLKGTFTRALKEAAEGIKEAVQVLLDRTTSEEVKKLQEENNRLKSRMEDLQKENGIYGITNLGRGYQKAHTETKEARRWSRKTGRGGKAASGSEPWNSLHRFATCCDRIRFQYLDDGHEPKKETEEWP
ncbi:hypothetical protein PYW08_004342 [Mythimna loreyi]|uniref:Uncharacterized protein n=1 Tax=Mythimna loreyi TaxID=667449 RepID=A0ACC2QPM5_9NEOP|nr:hypothetical protein PYW08_004342 [Mythimna loreyi]